MTSAEFDLPHLQILEKLVENHLHRLYIVDECGQACWCGDTDRHPACGHKPVTLTRMTGHGGSNTQQGSLGKGRKEWCKKPQLGL